MTLNSCIGSLPPHQYFEPNALVIIVLLTLIQAHFPTMTPIFSSSFSKDQSLYLILQTRICTLAQQQLHQFLVITVSSNVENGPAVLPFNDNS